MAVKGIPACTSRIGVHGGRRRPLPESRLAEPREIQLTVYVGAGALAVICGLVAVLRRKAMVVLAAFFVVFLDLRAALGLGVVEASQRNRKAAAVTPSSAMRSAHCCRYRSAPS